MSSPTPVIPRDQLIEFLQNQPADSSFEELYRELAFLRQVGLGLADVDAGRVVSDEEALRRIQSWRK